MIDLHHGDALDVFRSVRGLAAIVADLPCSCGEERWWACPVAELGRLTAGHERLSVYRPSFIYDAKASRAERQAGCEGLLSVRDNDAPIGWRRVSAEEHAAAPEKDRREGNTHPTIKSVGCGTDDGLMRWLVRLVTPEGGPVLDGMMGS